MKVEKYKLGEILNFYNGEMRPPSKGKYPVYGGNGIIDYVGEYNYEDNIIIGRVGANCGSVQECSGKCWVSDNAISVTVKKEFDKKCIFYILKTLNLNNKHVGAAQPLLTQNILTELSVLLPNIASQKKIAAVLSALDDKIALNRRMNSKLEQMAKRLYDHWFVQFDFPRSVSAEPCLHELCRTDDGNREVIFRMQTASPIRQAAAKCSGTKHSNARFRMGGK